MENLYDEIKRIITMSKKYGLGDTGWTKGSIFGYSNSYTLSKDILKIIMPGYISDTTPEPTPPNDVLIKFDNDLLFENGHFTNLATEKVRELILSEINVLSSFYDGVMEQKMKDREIQNTLDDCQEMLNDSKRILKEHKRYMARESMKLSISLAGDSIKDTANKGFKFIKGKISGK